jgi:hypothetical protein
MIVGIMPGGSFATGRSRFCVVLHRPGMAALLGPEEVHGPCPGARYLGFPTAWINRGDNAFEEMGQKPDWKPGGLDDLSTFLDDHP